MKIWDHQVVTDSDNPIGMHPVKIAGNVPYDEGNIPYASIINEDVVDTSVANPRYFEILLASPTIVDITNEYKDVDPESSYVLKFIVNNEEKLTVGVQKRYGAILLSSPIFVEIPLSAPDVEIGWKYDGTNFYCPENFDAYSDSYY